METRRGPRSGRRQRGNAPQYDITSRRPWRPNPTLDPDDAVKLFKMMEETGLSASGVLQQLVRRAEVDNDGRPAWADEIDNLVQLPLPTDRPAADALWREEA